MSKVDQFCSISLNLAHFCSLFQDEEAKKKKAAKEAKANGKGPNKKKKGKKSSEKKAPGKENPLKGFLDKPKKNTNSKIQELESASEVSAQDRDIHSGA